MEKVIDISDLGGGVPLKAHAGIGFAHAGTIVNYLYQAFARIVDIQFDFCSAGIHRILQQFFHGTGRPLNHFTGSNLVGNIIGE